MELLKQSIELIEKQAGRIVYTSSVYETSPWGFQDDTYFLNQVVAIETLLSPFDLLAALLNIESAIGRIRTGKNYSSRLIDIDILFYGNQVIDQKHLKVPHPRLHERRFALVPLAEIAGELVHPVFSLTINQLVGQCMDQSEVKPYTNKAFAQNPPTK
jgi:2-amino-4-hydroxy-6-hydroxymethyldihydropteridine diphosphokinase